MEDIINYNNINNGKIMGSTNPNPAGCKAPVNLIGY